MFKCNEAQMWNRVMLSTRKKKSYILVVYIVFYKLKSKKQCNQNEDQ